MIFALSVSGPTASGKTAVSIELAKHFGGEVIGCDSMQIYREMSIGTAKPTVSEMSGVPHHLIDFLSPEESFSVERYRSMAMCAANDITKRTAKGENQGIRYEQVVSVKKCTTTSLFIHYNWIIYCSKQF